jgi:hypothetical protein
MSNYLTKHRWKLLDSSLAPSFTFIMRGTQSQETKITSAQLLLHV